MIRSVSIYGQKISFKVLLKIQSFAVVNEEIYYRKFWRVFRNNIREIIGNKKFTFSVVT